MRPLRLPPGKEDIAFYLDGVSFVYKRNPLNNSASPKTSKWRKQGKGLLITGRGSNDLVARRRLRFVVVIALGKGVILREPYEKMNGRFFLQFITDHFNLCLAAAGPKRNGRLFVMDNDPSQNSGSTCQAIQEVVAKLHKFPPRSPERNPIEHIFHVLRNLLDDEAETCNITHELSINSKEEFLVHLNALGLNLQITQLKLFESALMLSSPPKEVDQSIKMRKTLVCKFSFPFFSVPKPKRKYKSRVNSQQFIYLNNKGRYS